MPQHCFSARLQSAPRPPAKSRRLLIRKVVHVGPVHGKPQGRPRKGSVNGGAFALHVASQMAEARRSTLLWAINKHTN
eukprot:1528084-Alexandrium_andersonii.AAC.1